MWGEPMPEDVRDAPPDGDGGTLLAPWRVRLTSRQQAWVQAFAAEHGLAQVEALRALLERGHRVITSPAEEQAHPHLHAPLSELNEAIEALSASISEMHDAIQEIAAVLGALGNAYGKVWVESLMANRLLMDAHHRGLVERARDMTSRYMERASAGGRASDSGA